MQQWSLYPEDQRPTGFREKNVEIMQKINQRMHKAHDNVQKIIQIVDGVGEQLPQRRQEIKAEIERLLNEADDHIQMITDQLLPQIQQWYNEAIRQYGYPKWPQSQAASQYNAAVNRVNQHIQELQTRYDKLINEGEYVSDAMLSLPHADDTSFMLRARLLGLKQSLSSKFMDLQAYDVSHQSIENIEQEIQQVEQIMEHVSSVLDLARAQVTEQGMLVLYDYYAVLNSAIRSA